MTWLKPTYTSHSCGMEVNMYAPDEDGDVFLRRARMQAERRDVARDTGLAA